MCRLVKQTPISFAQHLLVLLLPYVIMSQSRASDSLAYLGRLDHVEVRDFLWEHYDGEDWVHILIRDTSLTVHGGLARRYRSLDDSVSYMLNSLAGSGHNTGLGSPIMHGDFNGDGRRDFVGSGVWVFLGADTGYVADSIKGDRLVSTIVADVDGDGFDDIGSSVSRGWKIRWGDSINPLETASLFLLPEVELRGDTVGGSRLPEFMDRYNGVTITIGYTHIKWRVEGVETYYLNAWRVNESELIAHLDTIHSDSVMTQNPNLTSAGGNIIKRFGDTTISQGRTGCILIHAEGFTIVNETGPSKPIGEIAGFGMEWDQRFLPYDFHVRDSVVTLLQFDPDSMKYRYTHEFRYGEVDSGSVRRYCSMFPDLNDDGHLELAITYEKDYDKFYTNVYDVWNSVPLTSVHERGEQVSWCEPVVSDQSIMWKDAAIGACTVDVCDLSGKLLKQFTTTGEQAREGLSLPKGLNGNDVMLIRVFQNGWVQSFKMVVTSDQ